MEEQETINMAALIDMTEEREKEIASILIDSSLYLEMSLAERKRLLNYIVTMYC